MFLRKQSSLSTEKYEFQFSIPLKYVTKPSVVKCFQVGEMNSCATETKKEQQSRAEHLL